MSAVDARRGFSRVLVANRGEIAVRVVRAAADAGLESVAVYADPDADAPFVRLADQAFALGGTTPAQTYLSIERILAAAQRSGADAVHPGYGFLSENADFAQAVIDAGLTWIGPPPQAMRDLGDKVTARHLALRVGAPLVPGTPDPVAGADEALAFAREHGLPIAIKAAFGGGGRGLKVARTLAEVPELFDSATREAVAAFGRGECFVERYLDRPRHVEAQVLADTHGGVLVVGTRDCSLQRRFAKLVEEAPAPFLEPDQRAQIHDAATAICREAGYVGAGTVEFLIAEDGLVTFLEVNTRLQVEHPVTEETSGLDLVLAQFAIAAGGRVPDAAQVEPRGHSLEFRITAEDPRGQFLPGQGTVSRYVVPTGPGVRLDSGIEVGSVVGGHFDSLLAKLVVTGASRAQALARARRALAELRIEGLPTTIDVHRALVDDPAFVGDGSSFTVHTRWLETEWSGELPEPVTDGGPAAGGEAQQVADRPEPRTMVLEVDGRRVSVRVLDDGRPPAEAAVSDGRRPRRGSRGIGRGGQGGRGGSGASPDAPEGAVLAPLTGTVTRVAVQPDQDVEAGDLLVVLEAMKMEHAVTASAAGRVGEALVEVGASVTAGDVLAVVQPQ